MFLGICIGSNMISVHNIDVHVAILEGRIDVLLPEHVEHCYESYPDLVEEFTNVTKEEQACFVTLFSMEDVNNLK